MTVSADREPTWRFVLTTALLSRITMLIGLYAGHNALGFPTKVAGSWEGVRNWWLNPLTFYDTEQFLGIAARGYDRTRVAFFPLYPNLLRLGGTSAVARAGVGVLISTVAFVGALFLAHAWTRTAHGERTARRVVWLVAFFPLGVLWSSVYTESLFLFGLAGTLWATRSRRWALAIPFGLLAGATRNTGLVLSVALLAEMLVRARRERSRVRLVAVGACLSPLVPFVAFEAWVIDRFGSDAPRAAQEAFGRRLRAPWWAIGQDLRTMVEAGPGLIATMNLAAVLLGIIAAVVAATRGRWLGTLLILGVLAMHLTFPTSNVPHTTGALRYLMPLLPFHEEIAAFFERRDLSVLMRRTGQATWVLFGVYLSQQVGQKFFVMG